MAVKISGVLIIISVICSFVTNSTSSLTQAAISGGGRAVTIAFSLMSMMCLWGGIMKAAERWGVLSFISRLLSPILTPVFPSAFKKKEGDKEISAALTANILGVGNAATPLALNAVKKLEKRNDSSAGDDLITFTLLGCAPPCLFPTTVVSLRASSGSVSPADIVPLVWICSFILSAISVILSRLMARHKT